MEYLTLKELARKNEIAETTTRRYISQFSEFFRPETEGQRTLYPGEDGETLQRISDLYRQGLTSSQIKNKLAGEFSLNIEPAEESYLPATDKERDIQARERLAQALEYLADQKAAIEQIEERSQALEQKDQDRERQLQELQDRLDKLEQQDQDKRPWWKRIFGGVVNLR